MIVCCKDCKDRRIGCHGVCERYKSERALYNDQMKTHKENESFRTYEVERAIRIKYKH